MNHELGTPLLISLVLLIVMIGVVIWWYGVRKAATGQTVTFRASGNRDDLTLIDGIGPTLQTKLNNLGITSFRQIAELTEQDIQQINQQLAFKGRIEREGWVAQARKLVEAGSRSASGTAASTRDEQGADRAAVETSKRVGKKTTTKKKATAKKTASSATKKTAKKTAKKEARKTAKKTGKKTKTTKRT